MVNEVLGWHFIADNGKLRDGQPLEKRVYVVHEPLNMCKSGLHGSLQVLDALQYAPGAIVCRVRSFGEILGLQCEMGCEHYPKHDKYVSSHREVLAFADATMVLHEFACQCAERALRAAGETNQTYWNTIAVKREWMAGRASDKELAVARGAAWGAARGVVRDAAWDTALDAARGAACSAALNDSNTLLEKMCMDLLYPTSTEEKV